MFVIAPLRRIKGENSFPEYEQAMKDLQDAAIARAKEVWKGFEFGGVYPSNRQFGIAPLRANEMAHDVSASTLSGTYSYRKNLGSTGWVDLFNYTVRDDIIHAFCGFQVTDEVLRLLSFRFEVSDLKYPICDVQEAMGWGSFAIIFKADEGKELIATAQTGVQIRGYVESTGYQRIVPIGFQLYKRKDLMLTET